MPWAFLTVPLGFLGRMKSQVFFSYLPKVIVAQFPSMDSLKQSRCVQFWLDSSHCFQFLPGITAVPREIQNNAYRRCASGELFFLCSFVWSCVEPWIATVHRMWFVICVLFVNEPRSSQLSKRQVHHNKLNHRVPLITEGRVHSLWNTIYMK